MKYFRYFCLIIGFTAVVCFFFGKFLASSLLGFATVGLTGGAWFINLRDTKDQIAQLRRKLVDEERRSRDFEQQLDVKNQLLDVCRRDRNAAETRLKEVQEIHAAFVKAVDPIPGTAERCLIRTVEAEQIGNMFQQVLQQSVDG